MLLLPLSHRGRRTLVRDSSVALAGFHPNPLYKAIDLGEFKEVDVTTAGVALHAATMKFSHPLLIEQYQVQDLESQLRVVIEIMVSGLKRG
jgi:hypothetical protein